MKRFVWLFVSVLFLAACGAAAPASEPAETAVSPTTAPAAEQAAPADPLTVSLEQASMVRESDWVKGAMVPVVTIIEYGDFQ